MATNKQKTYWHALSPVGTPPNDNPVLEVWPAEGGWGFTVWQGNTEVSESGQACYATKEAAYEYGVAAAQEFM